MVVLYLEPQRPRNSLKFVHALWIFSQKSKVFAGRQSVAKSKSIGRCGNFFLSRFFPLDLKRRSLGRLWIRASSSARHPTPSFGFAGAPVLDLLIRRPSWGGCGWGRMAGLKQPYPAQCAALCFPSIRSSHTRFPPLPLSPSCTECFLTLVFAGRPAICFISARPSPSPPSPSNERFPSTPCVHCLLSFVASRPDGLARVVASSLAWP